MIEHMNIIDALSDQITALLELMQCANDSADISSIRVASEMCLTMHDELMAEVDKISKELKEQEKSKVIEILKETDLPNIKDGKEVDIGHSYVYKTDCCGDRYIKAEEVKYLLKNERNEAIDEFARKLYEVCNEMIETCGSNTAPISWAEAYADFKVDIEETAEQLKEQKCGIH